MSAIATQFIPADLLFQPAKKRKIASATLEAKRIGQNPRSEPEVRLWKVSTQAAAKDSAVIRVFILALFLASAAASVIGGFVELSHLLQTDAVGHVAAKAILTTDEL